MPIFFGRAKINIFFTIRYQSWLKKQNSLKKHEVEEIIADDTMF